MDWRLGKKEKKEVEIELNRRRKGKSIRTIKREHSLNCRSGKPFNFYIFFQRYCTNMYVYEIYFRPKRLPNNCVGQCHHKVNRRTRFSSFKCDLCLPMQGVTIWGQPNRTDRHFLLKRRAVTITIYIYQRLYLAYLTKSSTTSEFTLEKSHR